MNRLTVVGGFATAGVRAFGAAMFAAVAAVPLFAQDPPRPAGGPGGPAASRRPPLPLAASRKASFTATEATWLSLDVSPDGKTIVFDLGFAQLGETAGGGLPALFLRLVFDQQR